MAAGDGNLAICTADQAVAGTTLTDSSYLTFTVSANKTYNLLVVLGFRATAVSDAKFGFTGPSGFGGNIGGHIGDTGALFRPRAIDLNGGVQSLGTQPAFSGC